MGYSTGLAIAHALSDLGSQAALSKVRIFILETLYAQGTREKGGRHAHKQVLSVMKPMPQPFQGYEHGEEENFPSTLPAELHV